jgi:hypothetical protein
VFSVVVDIALEVVRSVAPYTSDAAIESNSALIVTMVVNTNMPTIFSRA